MAALVAKNHNEGLATFVSRLEMNGKSAKTSASTVRVMFELLLVSKIKDLSGVGP